MVEPYFTSIDLMKPHITFTPAFAVLLALVAAPSLAQVAAPPPQLAGVVGLSASASVDVQKDILAITFSTSKDGADANAVQSQLKQALDAAVAEAKKAARPGQVDVSTGNFSLFPRYAQRGGITGWQGSAELIVEGRDLQAIAQLSGRITTMTVARVGYRLSREATQKLEGEIAAEAIARFRAKAGEYAKHFGFGTYMIREVNVSTSEGERPPIPMMRAQTMSASPAEALAVEPGKATVTANVNGTVQMR